MRNADSEGDGGIRGFPGGTVVGRAADGWLAHRITLWGTGPILQSIGSCGASAAGIAGEWMPGSGEPETPDPARTIAFGVESSKMQFTGR